jgi:hypothetical protein
MRKSSVYFIAWLYSCSASGGEYPQAIRILHDPFQKPAIPQANIAEPEASKASTQNTWVPLLKATLRAGRNSMANVNGKIIKLGETFNGYKLITVEGRSAVFIKNKQRIKLTIDESTNK